MQFANLSRTNFFWVVLTVMSFLPVPAMAQSGGRFTLTKSVQWGMVTLSPGEYRYSVHHATAGTVTLRSLSDGQAAIVMATSLSTTRSSSASHLVLERSGDTLYVKSLVLGEDGEELQFNTPARKYTEKEAALFQRTRTASLTNP
jgi:hypothetical protein